MWRDKAVKEDGRNAAPCSGWLVLLESGVVWVYDLRDVGRCGLRFLRWFGKG